MSVPKRRCTKGRRNRRRARFKLKTKNLVSCSHCARMINQREVCPYCGYYKGKEVVDMAKKAEKKRKKEKSKK